MKLFYLWVKEYKCFENAEICFCSDRKFSFDYESKKLTEINIDTSNNVFFIGDKSCIENISAIVGSNGSGKTSICDFLYEVLFLGVTDIEYILIFEKNKKLHFKSSYNLKSIKTKIKFDNDTYDKDFSILYYSPFYSPDRRFEEYAAITGIFKDISTSGLMETDLTTYQNPRIDTDYKGKYDVDKITAHSILDNNRIIAFLSCLNELKDKEFKLDLTLPEKVIYTVDKNILKKFEAECPSNSKLYTIYDSLKNKVKKNDSKCSFIENFCLAMFCNYATTYLFSQRGGYEKDIIDELIFRIENGFNHKGSSVINSFYSIFSELAYPSETTNKLEYEINNENAIERLNVINFLSKLSNKYYERNCLIFDLKKDFQKISTLTEIINLVKGTSSFCISEFFPLISSGEKSEFLFYARLMYGLTYLINSQKDKNILLFLDETEITLHPKLQQHLIHNLYIYLNAFYKKEKLRFHIIFATHSPILLSDIPMSNVVFLKKRSGNRISEVVQNRKQTFGANIFQLYNDSFFVESLPIGDFAKSQINKLVDIVNEVTVHNKLKPESKKEIPNEYKYILSIIGEPVTKKIIEDTLNDSYSD